MSEHWLVAAVARIEQTAADLHRAIDAAIDSARAARDNRLEGLPLSEVYERIGSSEVSEMRGGPTAAFREFERALMDARADGIRELVDEEGMTFSDIGAKTGVSRQMVARIYRMAKSGDARG